MRRGLNPEELTWAQHMDMIRDLLVRAAGWLTSGAVTLFEMLGVDSVAATGERFLELSWQALNTEVAPFVTPLGVLAFWAGIGFAFSIYGQINSFKAGGHYQAPSW